MIEWKSIRPRSGEKRIKASFCFRPRRTQQDVIVWLDYIYLFQEFEEARFSDEWRRGYWITKATLAPSQYRKFLEDLALNVTDPREKIREFAELLAKKGSK